MEAGERQLEIIDNLVELSRIHAGESLGTPVVTDPLRVLGNAFGKMGPKAAGRGVTLLMDADAEVGDVLVDPDGIERAVGNLLSNAIRHLDEGGVVRVAVSKEVPPTDADGPKSGLLKICVADSGPGIPEEDQSFLFQDLDQGDAFEVRRKQRNGTGLPLARRLIERHGGKIWVESSGRKGEGSRFFITLPLLEAGTSPSGGDGSEAPHPSTEDLG